MILRPKARELIIGLADDPTFGPVIVFGQGGIAVEVISDKALALPPLDLRLAHGLIARTRVSRILKAYRNVPAADEQAVALPFGQAGATGRRFPAKSARSTSIRFFPTKPESSPPSMPGVPIAPVARRRGPSGHPRFAIRPYPKEWERHVTLHDGRGAPGAPGPAGR